MKFKNPEWGLKDIIPAGSQAVFGARAILQKDYIEIPSDRYSLESNYHMEQFFIWWHDKGFPWLESNLHSKSLNPRIQQLHCFDDGNFHLRADTRASYGYLYLAAYLHYPCIEIDQDRFQFALEVLPPSQWRRNGNSESFHVSERIINNDVSIFVRINDRYFEFQDDARLTHEQRIERVKNDLTL